MKEGNIRPNYLMKRGDKLHAQDVQRLLERRNEFVKIPCPACGHHNYRIRFQKNGFTFVECIKCETLFINPRPTIDMLMEFYTASESVKYWNSKVFPASEKSRRNQISAPRAKKVIELCRKHNVPTKVLLDAGAGFGTFCEEVKKLAVLDRVVAVEPSHDLAKICYGKGLEIIEKPIEKVILREVKGVNIITNFELIEHLYWPKDFLLSCEKILPKKGILILTTPNIKGFDLVALGELSDNINGPSHLNYFHPKSIENLLHQCGFDVLEIQTPGKLDAELVRKKILNGELDISDCPFLKQILIEQWAVVGSAFQSFLAENLLSSHLWVVAKKI